jgi:hypothetical protein
MSRWLPDRQPGRPGCGTVGKVPETAWEAAIKGKGQVRERRADEACQNPRTAHPACWIEEAHVAGLTGLLREGPAGDQLKSRRQRRARPPSRRQWLGHAPRIRAVPPGRRRPAPVNPMVETLTAGSGSTLGVPYSDVVTQRETHW